MASAELGLIRRLRAADALAYNSGVEWTESPVASRGSEVPGAGTG